MKLNLKGLLFSASLLLSMLLSVNAVAQTSCCSSDKKEVKTACCSGDQSDAKAATGEATSGCTPSNCRGAQTKFGEARVITELRTSLIALKAGMEKSTDPSFEARSFDIHGIVGESDDESLQILVKEVKIVEAAFAKTMNHNSPSFNLPDNKAKQVRYLRKRIEALQAVL